MFARFAFAERNAGQLHRTLPSVVTAKSYVTSCQVSLLIVLIGLPSCVLQGEVNMRRLTSVLDYWLVSSVRW